MSWMFGEAESVEEVEPLDQSLWKWSRGTATNHGEESLMLHLATTDLGALWGVDYYVINVVSRKGTIIMPRLAILEVVKCSECPHYFDWGTPGGGDCEELQKKVGPNDPPNECPLYVGTREEVEKILRRVK